MTTARGLLHRVDPIMKLDALSNLTHLDHSNSNKKDEQAGQAL